MCHFWLLSSTVLYLDREPSSDEEIEVRNAACYRKSASIVVNVNKSQQITPTNFNISFLRNRDVTVQLLQPSVYSGLFETDSLLCRKPKERRTRRRHTLSTFPVAGEANQVDKYVCLHYNTLRFNIFGVGWIIQTLKGWMFNLIYIYSKAMTALDVTSIQIATAEANHPNI